MSDEELAEEYDRLEAEKVSIKARQNEVTAQQEVRKALASLSPSTLSIVKITLDGKIAPEGEPSAEAAQ